MVTNFLIEEIVLHLLLKLIVITSSIYQYLFQLHSCACLFQEHLCNLDRRHCFFVTCFAASTWAANLSAWSSASLAHKSICNLFATNNNSKRSATSGFLSFLLERAKLPLDILLQMWLDQFVFNSLLKDLY